MSSLFSPLMAVVYSAISAILLFWHAVWEAALGGADALNTNWTWVLGIVFLVLTVRVGLIPIVVKQLRSQRAMQLLQPRLKALQAKHKGDRQTMQKEIIELYRSEKINPILTFLPILLQAPVFFGLFHVLRHLRPTITSDHARTLYGWTLGQFDSASHARLFGAPIAASFNSTAAQLAPLGADASVVKVVAAVLIAAMVATTFLMTRQMIAKTGWAEDPQQKMVQRLMLYGIPFSLLISGALFPIGVVIYWVTQNLFALGQQTWILRTFPPDKGAAAQGR